jgi:lipoyl synthase
MTQAGESIPESPQSMRMSLAAAMTLGFKPGLFHRGARLHCINLLLTYQSGCVGRCAYCGLSTKGPGADGGKSFIRVAWPTYPLDEIVARISDRREKVKRICISMVTHRRAIEDTRSVCAQLRSSFDIPVSLLITPTILGRDDLLAFRDAGADKVGVAIDLATPELFSRYRGSGVSGPHQWGTYWERLADALEVFGKGNAGPHFMVGMGETEKEMVEAMGRASDMGGTTHLFSFYPEPGSAMAAHPVPEMDHYRRVQLARFLIDNQLCRGDGMTFDDRDRISDYGLPAAELERVIDSGEPFRTSGCVGYDGEVACNRPYANSRPGPDMRNYPFPPCEADVSRIRQQLE